MTLSILFGEALFFESRTLFEYAALVFIFFYLFVVLYEEPTLRRKFGESYQKYCKAIPRWLPLRIKG
jgi:protein-S-isoprenylcysteine O-methyltransferase Ste14